MAKQNLSLREKFGYGLGDMASNIVYQAVINVLMYFYTDVYEFHRRMKSNEGFCNYSAGNSVCTRNGGAQPEQQT